MRDILLLGSVPLKNAEDVFRTVAGVLGSAIKRIPDGETGWARTVWIQCQIPFFLGNSALEMVETDPARPGAYRPSAVPAEGIYSHTRPWQARARLRPNFDPEDVHFDGVGYADWGIESYRIFKHLRDTGTIPDGTRFQVSIPTPQDSQRFIPEESAALGPIYEQAVYADIQRLAREIPADQLAIQFDSITPLRYEAADKQTRRDIVGSFVRAGNAVPERVELGMHLCYGDFAHAHFKDPTDVGPMVELANGIAAGIQRRLDWLHMPVVRSRKDRAHFQPLEKLALPSETRLFLGLVHYTDGLEGTRARIAAASDVVAEFGIATECGLGRRPPGTIGDVLRIHREAAHMEASFA